MPSAGRAASSGDIASRMACVCSSEYSSAGWKFRLGFFSYRPKARDAVCHARQYSLEMTSPTGMSSQSMAAPMLCASCQPASLRVRWVAQLPITALTWSA